MQVFLIRHGQTTSDVEDRYGGLFEDHLTQKGIEQAQELALKLKDKKIEKVFVSPRLRAIETSVIIAKQVPAKFIAIEELSERNSYGVLTGLTKEEAQQKFPMEVEELEANNPYHHVKDSEDYYSWAERLLEKFNQIIQKEFEEEVQSIALITHGGPIRAIFREILGFEIEGVKDCAIVKLDYDGEGYEIININDLDEIHPNN